MEIWSLRGKKVLIVDDLPDMRTMMRTLVASLGAEDIKTARDGEQAMSLMETNKFDIVLCDYNLGEGKDGQQVLEEVRHRELLPYHTVFIMVTAENTMPMVMGAVEYSPDDYISKPIPKATLTARLRKLLDKKERLRPVLNAMQQRNYSAALIECDNLMEQDPTSRFDVLRIKGELLLTLGEYAKAREIYEALLELRDFTWASLGLAKALFHLEQYDKANDTLRELIRAQPMAVAAYDLLSQVLEKQDKMKEAQDIVSQALERSSKSVVRQRRLGEIAYRNEDFTAAEKAYKQAMRVGKGSCLRSPTEYAGLVRTLVKNSSPTEAAKVVETMSREFRDNHAAQLQTAMVDAVVQQSLGNEALGQQATERALKLFQSRPESVDSNVAMDLAEVCFHQGSVDSARDLLGHALRNQHEDAATLKRVADLFVDAGLESEAQSFIEAKVQEVTEINNNGVRLAQQGKLEESIDLFEKAAKGMPGNLTINLNAAQSLIMFMREKGVSRVNLQKAETYLNRVQAMNVVSPKYQKLKELLSQMASNQ